MNFDSFVLRIGAVSSNQYSCEGFLDCDGSLSDTDAHDIYAIKDASKQLYASDYQYCGMPYKDHTYGAQPPFSPLSCRDRLMQSADHPSYVFSKEEADSVPEIEVSVLGMEETVEDSITRCVCGFLHDDGYMICCDKCCVWQHIDCMEIDRQNIPDSYCCELCEPRTVNYKRAKMIQLRRREEIDTSATDTDPEEPANALASLGTRTVQPKLKGSKLRRSSQGSSRLFKTGKLMKAQQKMPDKLANLVRREKENIKVAVKKNKICRPETQRPKRLSKRLDILIPNKVENCKSEFSLVYPEPVRENEYCEDVKVYLSRVGMNGIDSPQQKGIFPEELTVCLYQVVDIKDDIKDDVKGLEAMCTVNAGKAIADFKGKVILSKDAPLESVSHENQPCLLFYSKIPNLDLCIDPSAFGGDARFIRRSCSPNAEMCHIIDNGKLLFIVKATKEISKASEITIPFDFNYRHMPNVKCACTRSNCPVVKFQKKVKAAVRSPEQQICRRQSSNEDRLVQNSQGNNSPTQSPTSPVKLLKLDKGREGNAAISPDDGISLTSVVNGPVPVTDASTVIMDKSPMTLRRSSRCSNDVRLCQDSKHRARPVQACVDQDDCYCVDVVSENIAVDSIEQLAANEPDSDGQKKLTREERKMEAIMRTFEKMAKREERRREAMARHDRKLEEFVDKPPEGDTTTVKVESPPLSWLQRSSGCTHLTDADIINVDDKTGVAGSIAQGAVPNLHSPLKHSRSKRMKRTRRNSHALCLSEPTHQTVQVSGTAVLRMETTSTCEIEGASVTSVVGFTKALPSPVREELLTAIPTACNVTSCDNDSYSASLSCPVSTVQAAAVIDSRCCVTEGCVDVRVIKKEVSASSPMSPTNATGDTQPKEAASTLCPTTAPLSSHCCSKGNAKKRWLRQAIVDEFGRGTVFSEVASTTPPLISQVAVPECWSGMLGDLSTGTISNVPVGHGRCSASATGSIEVLCKAPLKKRRLAPEYLPCLSSPTSVTSNCKGHVSQCSSYTDNISANSEMLNSDCFAQMDDGRFPGMHSGTISFGGTTGRLNSDCVGINTERRQLPTGDPLKLKCCDGFMGHANNEVCICAEKVSSDEKICVCNTAATCPDALSSSPRQSIFSSCNSLPTSRECVDMSMCNSKYDRFTRHIPISVCLGNDLRHRPNSPICCLGELESTQSKLTFESSCFDNDICHYSVPCMRQGYSPVGSIHTTACSGQATSTLHVSLNRPCPTCSQQMTIRHDLMLNVANAENFSGDVNDLFPTQAVPSVCTVAECERSDSTICHGKKCHPDMDMSFGCCSVPADSRYSTKIADPACVNPKVSVASCNDFLSDKFECDGPVTDDCARVNSYVSSSVLSCSIDDSVSSVSSSNTGDRTSRVTQHIDDVRVQRPHRFPSASYSESRFSYVEEGRSSLCSSAHSIDRKRSVSFGNVQHSILSDTVSSAEDFNMTLDSSVERPAHCADKDMSRGLVFSMSRSVVHQATSLGCCGDVTHVLCSSSCTACSLPHGRRISEQSDNSVDFDDNLFFESSGGDTISANDININFDKSHDPVTSFHIVCGAEAEAQQLIAHKPSVDLIESMITSTDDSCENVVVTSASVLTDESSDADHSWDPQYLITKLKNGRLRSPNCRAENSIGVDILHKGVDIETTVDAASSAQRLSEVQSAGGGVTALDSGIQSCGPEPGRGQEVRLGAVSSSDGNMTGIDNVVSSITDGADECPGGQDGDANEASDHCSNVPRGDVGCSARKLVVIRSGKERASAVDMLRLEADCIECGRSPSCSWNSLGTFDGGGGGGDDGSASMDCVLACEESVVDSTTHSVPLTRPTDGRCVKLVESLDSCECFCDSNYDSDAHLTFSGEDNNVEIALGPADSQSNALVDSEQEELPAGCDEASVLPSNHAASSDTAAGGTVSSVISETSIGNMSTMGEMTMNAITTTIYGSQLRQPPLASTTGELCPHDSSFSHVLPQINSSCFRMSSFSADSSHFAHCSTPQASVVEMRLDDCMGYSASEKSPEATTEDLSYDGHLNVQHSSSGSVVHIMSLCAQCNPATPPHRRKESLILIGSLHADPLLREPPITVVSSPCPMALQTSSAEQAATVNGSTSENGTNISLSDHGRPISSLEWSQFAMPSDSQATQPLKRKVSLSEYRSRHKNGSSIDLATVSQSSDNSRHSLYSDDIDKNITLSPLPLFKPTAVCLDNHKDVKDKQMSLSDRLRIEFGLETGDTYDDVNDDLGSRKANCEQAPPTQLLNGVMSGFGCAHSDPPSRRQKKNSSTISSNLLSSAFPHSLLDKSSLNMKPAAAGKCLSMNRTDKDTLQQGLALLVKMHSQRTVKPPTDGNPTGVFLETDINGSHKNR